MLSSDQNVSRDDPRLNEILAKYLQAVESGQAIDVEQFVREHAEYERELREFFADKRRLDDLAGRDAVGPAARHPVDAPTLPPNSATHLDAPTLDSISKSPTVPRPGALVRYFGEYELLEEIARGGMGVVYKARQVKLNRIVALKMILAGQLASKEDVQRFYTEAEAAAGLDHPGIVPIFEVGEHEGQHYFSMGYVEGQSLASRLADGPLPPREATELVRKVADAVQYAHERGVIHRDLKPANVLLQLERQSPETRVSAAAAQESTALPRSPVSSPQPKVTDFGLAKKTTADSNLTGTGQILGTPSYMPPEQAAGRVAEVRETADVYSLGAILYATLTGRPPFQADNPLDTLLQVMEREPVSPRTLNPAIPLDLETICLKCLEKDRRRRYPTARSLQRELQRFLNGQPIQARPISHIERGWRWCKRNPVVACLSLAVLLSLFAGTVMSTMFAVEARQRAAGESLQRRAAERHSAKLHLERSLSRCNPDDPSVGLLWLTRSLEEALRIKDARLEQLCRLQISAWSCDVAPLQALLPTGLVGSASFDANGTTAYTGFDGNSIQRLDPHTGAPVGPPLVLASNVPHAFVTLDPAGRIAAVSRLDDAVQCFDLQTGQPVGEPLRSSMRGGKTMRSVAFSGDGLRLLTISENNSIRLWRISSGESVEIPLTETAGMPHAAAFSPDGKVLLIAFDHQVWTYDGETGVASGAISALGKWILGMTFSPDGTQLLTATSTEAQLWDVKTWRRSGPSWPLVLSITSYGYDDHPALAFSHDGRLAATGDREAVRVWDVASGTPFTSPLRLRFLSAVHGESVLAVAFSPDDSLLLAGGASTTSCVWNIGRHRESVRLLSHPGLIHGEFSPDGRLLVTGSHANGAQLWDVATGKPHGPSLDLPGSVWALSFHPGGESILTGSNSHLARLWSVATGEPLTPPLQHSHFVTDVRFAPDGRSFWTASRDGKVQRWDSTTGQALQAPLDHGHVLDLDRIHVSPDGRALLVTFAGVTLDKSRHQLWNVGEGAAGSVPLQTSGVAFFDPDNRSLWTGTSRLTRVDSRSGKPMGDAVEISGSVAAFDKQVDHVLVVNDTDDTAVWWDLRNARAAGMPFDLNGIWRGTSSTMGVSPIVKPNNMRGGPSPLSPDDQLVVVGTNRERFGAVQYFDLETGQQIGPPRLRGAHLKQVGFSAAGDTVLSVLDNGTAIIESAVHPLDGKLEKIVARIEYLTGLKLNTNGVVHLLTPEEWNRRLLNERTTDTR